MVMFFCYTNLDVVEVEVVTRKRQWLRYSAFPIAPTYESLAKT